MALTEVTPPVVTYSSASSDQFSATYVVSYSDIPEDMFQRAYDAQSASVGGVSVVEKDGVVAIDGIDFRCTDVKVSSLDDGLGQHWQVVCSLTTDQRKQQQNGRSPLSEPAVLSWSNETIMFDLEVDRSDPPKRVQNTAGDFFDPQPQEARYLEVVTIQKNVSSYNGTGLRNLRGCINNSNVSIKGISYPAKSLLCRGVSAQTQRVEVFDYDAVTVEMIHNPDLWELTRYSVGYYEKVSGKKVPILDETKNRVSAPWPLNEDGTKKSAPDAEPYLITFKPKLEVSFGPVTALL